MRRRPPAADAGGHEDGAGQDRRRLEEQLVRVVVAGLIQPSLTTVRQEMHGIGEAAAEGLGRMIDDPETQPVWRIVPTRLVVRSSCGAKRAPRERTLAIDKEVR